MAAHTCLATPRLGARGLGKLCIMRTCVAAGDAVAPGGARVRPARQRRHISHAVVANHGYAVVHLIPVKAWLRARSYCMHPANNACVRVFVCSCVRVFACLGNGPVRLVARVACSPHLFPRGCCRCGTMDFRQDTETNEQNDNKGDATCCSVGRDCHSVCSIRCEPFLVCVFTQSYRVRRTFNLTHGREHTN